MCSRYRCAEARTRNETWSRWRAGRSGRPSGTLRPLLPAHSRSRVSVLTSVRGLRMSLCHGGDSITNGFSPAGRYQLRSCMPGFDRGLVGLGDSDGEPDPPVGGAGPTLVDLARDLHLVRDPGAEPAACSPHRARGCDVGLGLSSHFEPLLPRLYGEPGPSRRPGLLRGRGARSGGPTPLLGSHPAPAARPPAKQWLRCAAGPSRAWRVRTPDRPRSRLVHCSMSTRRLARWRPDLIGEVPSVTQSSRCPWTHAVGRLSNGVHASPTGSDERTSMALSAESDCLVDSLPSESWPLTC